MAAAYLASASYRTLIVVVVVALVLALIWPNPVAASGFEELVTRLCSQSLELDACRNCILSDHSIGTDDVPTLTYSIIFCVYSQAVYGHNHADGLAQNVTAAGHRQALRVCSTALRGASERLWDTLTMMEVAHYQGAYENLNRSRWEALVYCENAYRKFAQDVAIPGTLLDDMTLAKRLFDVAQYFFRLILNVTL